MTDYDRLVSSVPANRTAAKVTGTGAHWTPEIHPNNAAGWQDTPLPVLPLPSAHPSQVAAMPKRGSTHGRLVVIGYGGKRSYGGVWVMRCRCGNYGYRSAKSLKNPNAFQMCNPCQYLETLKRGAHLAPKERAKAKAEKQARKAELQRKLSGAATLADMMPKP